MCKTNLQQTEMWISVTSNGLVPKRLPQMAGDFIAPFIEDAPAGIIVLTYSASSSTSSSLSLVDFYDKTSYRDQLRATTDALICSLY